MTHIKIKSPKEMKYLKVIMNKQVALMRRLAPKKHNKKSFYANKMDKEAYWVDKIFLERKQGIQHSLFIGFVCNLNGQNVVVPLEIDYLSYNPTFGIVDKGYIDSLLTHHLQVVVDSEDFNNPIPDAFFIELLPSLLIIFRLFLIDKAYKVNSGDRASFALSTANSPLGRLLVTCCNLLPINFIGRLALKYRVKLSITCFEGSYNVLHLPIHQIKKVYRRLYHEKLEDRIALEWKFLCFENN